MADERGSGQVHIRNQLAHVCTCTRAVMDVNCDLRLNNQAEGILLVRMFICQLLVQRIMYTRGVCAVAQLHYMSVQSLTVALYDSHSEN